MLSFNENLLSGTLSVILIPQKVIVIGFIVSMRLSHHRGFETFSFIAKFLTIIILVYVTFNYFVGLLGSLIASICSGWTIASSFRPT